MALAFHCPSCKRPLPVSAGMLGQKVTCAGCQTSFVLAPTHLQTPGAAPPVVAATPAPPPLTATTAATSALAAPPVAVIEPPRVVASVPVAPPRPAAAPASSAARTTTAPPPTALKAAPDGKLPTLALHADASSKTKSAGSSTPSTLLVFAALAISATLSVAVLLVDVEPKAAPTNEAQLAREQIQRFYGDSAAELLPYQKLLRESQRAHSRHDLPAERRCYRHVLELLRAESRTPSKTLTGTTGDDAELERVLTVLLRDVRETSLF